jgi:UDP-N-acetylmuramate--alanine ligase
VIAIAQPHRFSRLRDHMDDFQQAFNDADMVFISPVYAAGEAPIEGIDSEALVNGIKARGHRSAATVADANDLATKLADVVQDKDMIVCLGAGDITKWAAGLADAIQAVRG